MYASSDSFWQLPIPIVLASALNAAADLTGKAAETTVPLLKANWPADAEATIDDFLRDEARVAALVGGRDVLKAWSEEQIKLRTGTIAQLVGVLQRVDHRAADLRAQEGDDEVTTRLRMIGNVLEKLLQPMADGLSFPESLPTSEAVLAALAGDAALLAGHGFPPELRERLATLAAKVEADHRAARDHAVTRELATREVQDTLDRITRFLAAYARRVEILRQEGHRITGAEFAEAHQWHATRAAEVQERKERDAREASLPAAVREAVAAFRAETPIDDDDDDDAGR